MPNPFKYKNFLALFLLCISFAPLYAEAFGNSSVTIPRIGMSFFDIGFFPHKKPWGLSHLWTVGSSYMHAIDYRWWWTAEASVGFGNLTTNNQPFLSSISGSAGVRFNIFQDDFRPHVGLVLQYWHFLGEGARSIPLNLGWPIFVGLKPYFGVEWLFYSEMALIIDAGLGLYVNINEPFRHILHTSISYAFYF